MKALITGLNGQDGLLLSQQLLQEGHEVFGTIAPTETPNQLCEVGPSNIWKMDIRDSDKVSACIASILPDTIYHFAGITSVAASWEEPAQTIAINAVGTANLIQAVVKHSPLSHLIHAASTEIFDSSNGVINEESNIDPLSPYASSKASAFSLINSYRNRGYSFTNVCLSNHESFLRPATFVTGKIAIGVAEISLGLADSITLGDLSISKDWSSAHDVTRGIRTVGDQKFVGNIILASGFSTSVQEIVECAFDVVGIKDFMNYVVIDKALIRTNEVKAMRLDSSKAKELLGWAPEFSTRDWVTEMVNFHRERLSQMV